MDFGKHKRVMFAMAKLMEMETNLFNKIKSKKYCIRFQ